MVLGEGLQEKEWDGNTNPPQNKKQITWLYEALTDQQQFSAMHTYKISNINGLKWSNCQLMKPPVKRHDCNEVRPVI